MRCKIFLLSILIIIIPFVLAQDLEQQEVQFEEFPDDNFEENFPEDLPLEEIQEEEFEFPEEMALEDSEHPISEPYIEKDTDNKGIYYEIHYDEYERAVRVEDHFIRGYVGVVEYQYFPKLQRRERDGFYGYEWVVSREEGTFYKNGEPIAMRNYDFDKQGNIINKEREGTTIVIAIMRFLSAFYGVDPPEI